MNLFITKKLLYRLYKQLTLLKVIFSDCAIKKKEYMGIVYGSSMSVKYITKEYRQQGSKRTSIRRLSLGSIKLWSFIEMMEKWGDKEMEGRGGGDTRDFARGLKRWRHYRQVFKSLSQTGIGHTTVGTFQAELDINCHPEVALYTLDLVLMSFAMENKIPCSLMFINSWPTTN